MLCTDTYPVVCTRLYYLAHRTWDNSFDKCLDRDVCDVRFEVVHVQHVLLDGISGEDVIHVDGLRLPVSPQAIFRLEIRFGIEFSVEKKRRISMRKISPNAPSIDGDE